MSMLGLSQVGMAFVRQSLCLKTVRAMVRQTDAFARTVYEAGMEAGQWQGRTKPAAG